MTALTQDCPSGRGAHLNSVPPARTPRESQIARAFGLSFAVLMLCACLIGFAGKVFAANVCGAGTCKAESQHPLQLILLFDNSSYGNEVDTGGIYDAANVACTRWAQAESNIQYTYTFVGPCTPTLPIVSEGRQGNITVSGVLRQTRNDGVVTAQNPWSAILMYPQCDDAINRSNVYIGYDSQCYCKDGLSWSPSKYACISVQDIQPTLCPTCTAAKVGGVSSLLTSSENEFGNPVVPMYGAKVLREPLDIRIGRELLTIGYDTHWQIGITGASVINRSVGPAATPAISLGSLWTTSAHKSLYIQRTTTSSTGFVVQAYRGNGHFIAYTHPNAATYTPVNPAVREQLVPVLDGAGNQTSQVRLVDAQGNIELYDMYNISTGWRADLISVNYVDGGSVSYAYTTATPMPGLLARMTDDRGRLVRFSYEATQAAPGARLARITAPDGGIYAFGYDAKNNLAQITWPDGKVRQYLYERSDLPWAVTGITDENNARLSTYTYDSTGLATGTQLAGGANTYSVNYGAPPHVQATETWSGNVLTRVYNWSLPQEVKVSTPTGSQLALNGVLVNGAPVVAAQTQSAGSGSSEASSAMSFDGAGNITLRDDFSGNRTCYGYDASNRETTRVEGLTSTTVCSTVLPGGSTLPTGARKITTAWHPDWRLPMVLTVPLRKTSTVYHGQPDPFNGNVTANCTTAAVLPNGKPMPLVCKVVAQPLLANGTVDSSVPAQTDTYTYDSAGRVLTHLDAKNHSTSYAYYADRSFVGQSGNYDSAYELDGLLLHFNGIDGSTVITDKSLNNFAVTAVGNAHISAAQQKFGTGSLYMDGTGDYVTLGSTSDFAFLHQPNRQWTWEAWLRPANFAGTNTLFATFGSYSFQVGIIATLNSNRALGITWSNGSSYIMNNAATPAGAYPNDTVGWHHVAITMDSSLTTNCANFYVDGVYVGSSSRSGTPSSAATSNTSLRIGSFGISNGSSEFNGYIDDVRITNGKIRYTTAFTPPAQELPDQTPPLSLTDYGHSPGDLQSITNAAGQAVQYTQYDLASRIRQVVDAKGITTDIAYTPRGWVSTVTVTPPGGSVRTTTYGYDNAGQMTGVALPDGTSLAYTYDAAHRLTAVTDTLGNSVSYTLDAAGNRTGEEVRDGSGALQRSIARSFDALSRLQQVTGATQ